MPSSSASNASGEVFARSEAFSAAASETPLEYRSEGSPAGSDPFGVTGWAGSMPWERMDVVLDDQTFPISTTPADRMPVPPGLLAMPEQVATVALRVTGMHTERPVMFEPLIDVAEMLPYESTVGSLTTRVIARGRGEDRTIGLEVRVAVIGDQNAVLEAERLGAYLQGAYSSDRSVFDVTVCADSDWPTGGTVTVVRQQTVQTAAGPVPIRFAPGPRLGRDRLLRAVRFASSDIDVIVTVQPTTLTGDEEAGLARVQSNLLTLRDQPDRPSPARMVDGHPLERLIATATDATASYATSAWMSQIVIVENGASSEVTRRVIGQAIAGNYDTVDGPGHRTVANPSSFISGGFELVPVRDPGPLLAAARAGQLVQHDHRTISDVVTAGEIPNLMCWPTTNDGPIPGIALNPPRFDQLRRVGAGDLILGHVRDDGRPVGIDRREATQHVLYVGTTGAGKSAALHSTISQAVDAGRGVLVFDANDDLARLAAQAAHTAGREVVALDAGTGNMDRVCLWAADDNAGRDDLAYAVIEGATADLPTEYYGPMGRKFLEPAARICARLGLPISTISEYGTNVVLAREHAAQIGEPWATQWARELAGRSANERVELGSWVDAKLSGLARAAVSDTLLSTAPTTTVGGVLDRGGVVIVNPGTDPSINRIVTGVVLAAVDRWARGRNADSHPVDVVVDEAQNATGAMLTRCLTEWRKRNLSMHIAGTTLSMFADSADAAIANTSTTLLFRNRGGTAKLLGELFSLDAPDISRLANLVAYAATPTALEPLLVDIPTRPATPATYPPGMVEAIEFRRQVAADSRHAPQDPVDGGPFDEEATGAGEEERHPAQSSGPSFLDGWRAKRQSERTRSALDGDGEEC